MNKIKALFLAANPASTIRVQLDEEIRSITEKIRSSEYRDMIELVSSWAVRPDDMLQLLNQHKPQIVHFSGHGSQTGEIILHNNIGTATPVSPPAIKSLFRTLKDNIRLVVLNACYSRLQAEAIVENIDCVIGMNTAISDQASSLFAASLYRAIGFGRSVEEAFEQGRTALLLEGIPEENTPDLLCRVGVYPSQVYIVRATPVLFTDEMARQVYEVLRARQDLAGILAEGSVPFTESQHLRWQDYNQRLEQLLKFAPPEFEARIRSIM